VRWGRGDTPPRTPGAPWRPPGGPLAASSHGGGFLVRRKGSRPVVALAGRPPEIQ